MKRRRRRQASEIVSEEVLPYPIRGKKAVKCVVNDSTTGVEKTVLVLLDDGVKERRRNSLLIERERSANLEQNVSAKMKRRTDVVARKRIVNGGGKRGQSRFDFARKKSSPAVWNDRQKSQSRVHIARKKSNDGNRGQSRVVIARKKNPQGEATTTEPKRIDFSQLLGKGERIDPADLRLSMAILLPLVVAHVVATVIPINTGLFGSGLFLVALPVLTYFVGCEWFLLGNMHGLVEYRRLRIISRGFQYTSMVILCGTLFTSDLKLNVAFTLTGISAYICVARMMYLLRRFNFISEEVVIKQEQMSKDLATEMTSIKILLSLRIRVLSVVIAPICIAWVLSGISPLPRMLSFNTIMPLITRRIGSFLLLGAQGRSRPDLGGNLSTFFSMLGLALACIIPFAHILVLFSSGIYLFANVASLLLGSISWVLTICSFITFTEERKIEEEPIRVEVERQAWYETIIFVVTSTVIPVSVFAFGAQIYQIEDEQSLMRFLASPDGQKLAGLFLVGIPLGTIAFSALLRGSSLFSALPWGNSERPVKFLALLGFVSFAVAGGLFARFVIMGQNDFSGSIFVATGFFSWINIVSSLALNYYRSRSSHQTQLKMFTKKLRTIFSERAVAKVFATILMLSGCMLFGFASIVEFFVTLPFVRAMAVPVVNLAVTGVAYMSYSFVDDLPIAKHDGYNTVRAFFGWGVFASAMVFGWITAFCNLPQIGSLSDDYLEVMGPTCDWMSNKGSIALTGLLGWMTQIMVSGPFVDFAFGRRKRSKRKINVVVEEVDSGVEADVEFDGLPSPEKTIRSVSSSSPVEHQAAGEVAVEGRSALIDHDFKTFRIDREDSPIADQDGEIEEPSVEEFQEVAASDWSSDEPVVLFSKLHNDDNSVTNQRVRASVGSESSVLIPNVTVVSDDSSNSSSLICLANLE